MTDLSVPKTFLQVNWLERAITDLQVTHKNTCVVTNEYTHIQSYLAPVENTRSTSLLRNSFPKQASEAIPSQQGGKKAFLMGKNGRQGQLAVAARIIDGNCWGTRLRFMRRTTHWGLGETGVH